MLAQQNKYVNGSGTFPNWTAIDASGAGLTDGSEYAATPINDGFEAFQQAIMDYASGSANSPTGTPGTPNGVSEAAGVSQNLQALQIAHGIGPGNYVLWGKYDDPAVTGDRVILLAEQGLLIATYAELDAACYVGDANNAAVEAAGGYFYRSSDAAGATPNIAGPYIQLPPQPSPTYLKQYSEAAGDFTVTGTNWTTYFAYAIPIKTSNSEYWIFFSLQGGMTTGVPSDLVISGITTNASDDFQGFASITDNGGNTIYPGSARTYLNTTTGLIHAAASSSTTNSRTSIQGLMRLTTAPTWMDDFEFVWGIRY